MALFMRTKVMAGRWVSKSSNPNRQGVGFLKHNGVAKVHLFAGRFGTHEPQVCGVLVGIAAQAASNVAPVMVASMRKSLSSSFSCSSEIVG